VLLLPATLPSLTGAACSLLAALAKTKRVADASETAAFCGGGGPGGGSGGGGLPTGTGGGGGGATTAGGAPGPGMFLLPKLTASSSGVASAARGICGGGFGPPMLTWFATGVGALP